MNIDTYIDIHIHTYIRISCRKEKIKLNRQLPHLVANVAEILELEPDQDDEAPAPDPSFRGPGVLAFV